MNTSKQPTEQQRPGGSQPLDEYVEGVICKVSDLNENEPKVFPLDKGEVLVVKQNNHISALGTTCTHYGAPLVNSVVGDGRLRCQWHGACFNLLNGDIENFPGFDSLPCYKVSINNDQVKVRAKKSELKSNKRIKPMAKRNPNDSRHFVVVGGGPAGAECVEALRQEGFEGQITLICREKHLPYDRVKVSKEMDFDITENQFRTDAFYKEYDIDVLKGISATGVNVEMKTVFLSNGNSLTYDKLFIATGSKAKSIDNIPGGDLKNVISLRDYEDAKYIFNHLAKDKEIVVVGSSFVSLETVSYCLTKVKKITVIIRGERIFQPLLGPRIGEAFMKLYRENNVNFITRSSLMEVQKDENTNVTTVVLKTGETLIADLLIIGIGTIHCTDFLQNSGIEVRSDGTIETNEYLQTNNADVFVGGDIAYCPIWASNNKKFALGNFIVALHHGKIAALNMLSRNEKLKIVPFTWTSILGREIRCVGRDDYDEIRYMGNVEEYKYVAFYLKNGEVVSVSTCNMDPVASQFAEYLAQGKKLLKEHIQKDPFGWTKEINSKNLKNNVLKMSDEFVEEVVCQISDLNENEPKVFPLDKGEVLLIKQHNHISALGTTCTHYGAPLVNCAVGEGRLRCQWHGACFNLFTGDIEEFPGFDSLPCYQVYLNNNDVTVRAKKLELQSVKRIKPMAKNNLCDLSHFVVVGGGPAGAQCVEVLRQEGFGGEITLVCKENCLPYDRIQYSKAMDFDIAKAEFRTDSFYKEYDINVLKGVEATQLNINKKTISLSNNSVLSYDKLFIATGSKPRHLSVPGGDLKNVTTLRSYEDAQYISNQLGEDKDVVILGSSFIAMEAATFCVGKVKILTIVMIEDVPFAYSFGTEIGQAVKQLFEEKGITFVANSSITKINGDDSGNVVSIELANGEILKADLVLLGIGTECCTEWIVNSGIIILPNSAVEVNEYLQTNNSDIFVGGDIAFAPVWPYGKKSAIGHFGLAHYHGKIAALNMLGKDKKLEAVPYFWSMLFGKSFRYAGHGEYDEIIYKGNVKEYKYVAFYLKNDEVVSVCSCGMDPVVSQFAEHLAQGKKLFKHHLEENPLALFKKFNT